MRGFLALLVGSLSLLPVAAAGSPEAPEVTDPAGDVAAFGAPAPAGFGWADLQAAWFESNGAGDGASFALSIRVGDGADPPPQGEVGMTFRAGDLHYIAGYTVVPGLYSGGFLSVSDEDGDVPSGVSPRSVDGTFQDGLVVVSFTAGDLEDANATSFAQPWAWSESRATNGDVWRLDRTDIGLDFPWAAPEAGPALQGPEGAAGEARDSPAPLAVALLPLLLVAWGRRRSPSP